MNESPLLNRHFQRRQKAAVAGLHLPTAEELLRGMAFFRDDLIEDIREYSGRLSASVKKRNGGGLELLAASLDMLNFDPSEEGVLAVEAALDHSDEVERLPINQCRLRCRFYRAVFGNGQATALIAGEIAHLASEDIGSGRGNELLSRSLGWALQSRALDRRQRLGISVQGYSDWFFPEIRTYEVHFTNAIVKATGNELEALDSALDVLGVAKCEKESLEGLERPRDGVVVFGGIGNEGTADGKRVAREFAKLSQRPLPLSATPELNGVRSRLVTEFPHAAAVTDKLLEDLSGRSTVHMRPVILLGSPGCGKTRFARRLSEEMGAPYNLVSCGGLSDSAIGGTARRWSSGEPSLPVMAVCQHGCANPIVILDEIEKIGTSRHNGNVHDVLIGLLELETSERWHDPYLQANCDLSHVSWLMTANSIEPIPSALRDRCRILRFPDPEADQLAVFSARILERLYIEAGHDPRWATPLEQFELDALADVWTGGSLRRLERLVEGLREARERARQQH
ncbi:ATPase family protein associated with various cellular activities (AAA) [Rhizobium sp. PP-F2F-G48]|uniref:AAA family ATPase n=1 Tax=Rhizobium sp. PP-F2F-G48 TaxID=2135651 RepID=UPI0010CE7AB9|nr:AAA family ATPase [Rhizobium sp. PP-F2F-G48]TCM55659.1 ATPase family protein associated with various cellular activities (AAA) [Rhizobium sp. PP-F2F-G48]